MFKKQYSKTKPVCKVTFILPEAAAPAADEVRLLGDFNAWDYENGYLMKLANGEYKTTVELEAGRSYEFRYLVNGQTWVNDWEADDYAPSPFHNADNSVLKLDPVVLDAAPAAPKKKEAKTAKAAPKAAPKAAAPKESRQPAAPKKAAAPKEAKKPAARKAVAPAPAAKDDLTRIEGVGPKIEQLLNDGGIRTFEALAKAKPAAVKAILETAGPRYKMHDPATWAEQAKLAARGEWEKLSTLQEQLKGGRKK